MLVRIGESEKEPRFVNVRLVIVVIIQLVSFDIHQSKCSACVLNLLLEYHWVGQPTCALPYPPLPKPLSRFDTKIALKDLLS